MDIESIIKKKQFKKGDKKPSHEAIADYLVDHFRDEDSRPYFELVAKQLDRLTIKRLANESKHGHHPVRLFVYKCNAIIRNTITTNSQ